MTPPNNETGDSLFTNDMIFILIVVTIYQQAVLTIIFYFGEIWFVYMHKDFIPTVTNCHVPPLGDIDGPARWREEHLYCELDPNKAT